MIHKMKLNDAPFRSIKARTKTIEMRLCDEKRQLIKSGDIIEFSHRETGEKLLTRVCNLIKFKNFSELYASFDKVSLGYLENQDAAPRDMCQHYQCQDIEKYGVLAIEIELL